MELVNTFFNWESLLSIQGTHIPATRALPIREWRSGAATSQPHLAYKSNGPTPLHFEVDRLRHLPQFTFFRNFLSGFFLVSPNL